MKKVVDNIDGKILQKGLLRICVAVLFLTVSVFFFWYNGRERELEEIRFSLEVIHPTCTDGGYSLYTDINSGQVIMQDFVAATGHTFEQWKTDVDATLFDAGSCSRRCIVCNEVENVRMYLSFGIPVIALDGSLDGIGKKTEVSMNAVFRSAEKEFSSYATLKYQGHSSLKYPKKNYTLKFWKNHKNEEKNKMAFSHWNKENKYILKSEYIDPTMCRNLICADVWAAVTESREDKPELFSKLSNYGAVDGFLSALYINGEFRGLYNMNLHKDNELFGMSDGKNHAIVINNDPETSAAYFKELADFEENETWEVEFCGSKDSTWVKDKLNELIAFVIESDDATFQNELSKYLNVNSAIDYLLSMYVLGLTNHGADELILVCYDNDEPWIASLYDMETGFGLSKDGKKFLCDTEFLPELKNDTWYSGTDNMLWDRLLQNFYPQICARYAQLRQDIFAPETLCKRVDDFTGDIPKELYEANYQFHGELPNASTGIEQIHTYIKARIEQIDKLFL